MFRLVHFALLIPIFLFGCLATCIGQVGRPLLFLKKVPGLSQNTVFSLRQDSAGFIWAATADGLNRFDGRRFDVYKPGNSISSRMMRGHILRYPVVEDAHSNFWFYTESGNHYYDVQHNLVEPLPANIIPSVGLNSMPVAFHKGLLWMFDGSGNLSAYNQVWKKIYSVNAPPFSHNQVIQKTIFNSKYIFIVWFGVTGIFDMQTRQWQQVPLKGVVNAIACNQTEVIACAGQKIFRWLIGSTTAMELKPEEPGTFISGWRTVYIDNDGNSWAGNEQGYVFKCDAGKNTFSAVANVNEGNSGGSQTPVYSLLVDRTRNLWVGTDGMGLLKADLKSPGFHCYPAKEYTSNGVRYFIKSICEDYEGNVWLGTLGTGLMLMRHGNKEPVAVSLPIKPKVDQVLINVITEDNNQNLLVGYHNIVAIKKKGSKIFRPVTLPDSATSNSVSETVESILPLESGKWLVISNWRTCVLNEKRNGDFAWTTIFNFAFASEVLLNDSILIAASESGIIYRFNIHDGEDKFKTLANNVFVKSISPVQNNKGLYWMSTKSGLILYNSIVNKFKHYDENDGIENSFVYGCLQKGNILWLSTNNGLTRVTLGTKNSNGFPVINTDHFTTEEGVQGNEFNTNAFHIGRSGKFYFGSVNGLTWFYPDSIYKNPYFPSLVLTSAETDNAVLFSDSNSIYLNQIELPFSHRNLALRFAALEFSNPAQNRYAWRMPGVQNNWVDIGNQNEIRIANLPYGSYKMEVKASNNSGVWMTQPAVLNVTVITPFWRKWWFFLMIICILLVGTALFTRSISQRKLKFKVAQLEYERSLETERQRIAREMHDDVGAGLTQISFLSEGARRQISGEALVENDLQRISDKTRELVRSISEIVWSLNSENNTLESLLYKLHEQSSEQLELSDIGFTIQIPGKIPSFRISSQMARNVLLVVKEVINNTVRHSGASKISIDVKIIKGFLEIIITDNGVGMPPVLKPGNGIRNIKHRIHELLGNLELVNEDGLRIEMRIPLNPIST